MPEIVVRACRTESEVDAFCALAARTFRRERDPVVEAANRKTRYRAAPWHRPEQLRGAFRDGAFVGGYIVEERVLRIGAARLTTGCIGAVMVHPEHRGQGIARRLMADAVAFARERGLALLLLDGITGMYARFGYADVFDPVAHHVSRAAILDLGESEYTVRPAGADDAEALLDLYRRGFWRYDGAFDRTIEEQRWRLERYGAWLVAVDPVGVVRGSSTLPAGPRHDWISELCADDWPALLALLRRHAAEPAHTGAEGPPEELRLALPPRSPALWLLADCLPLRSVSWRVLDGEWMARLGDPAALFRAMLPAWRARSLGYGGEKTSFVLAVEDVAYTLGFGDGEWIALPDPLPDLPRLDLTPQAFVQLLFGYRPVDVVGAPAELLPALEALFPYGGAWIPGSDDF